MITQIPFDSERLSYREIALQDTHILVKWRSDPSVIKYYLNPQPIDERQHIDWYHSKYMTDENRVDFIISTKDTFTPIGFIGLNKTGEDTADISYTIGNQDFQRKGYAKESIQALIGSVNSCSIAKFSAVIHQGNVASISTAQSLGFQFKCKRGSFIEMEYCTVSDNLS